LPEPGQLLLERRIASGSDLDVLRVCADGSVWSCANVSASLEDGEWTFTRGLEPSWAHDTDIPAGALAALREAIAASGFFDAEPEQHPRRTVIHGADHTWTAALDGRTHTVTLHGVPEVDAPAVTAVSEALEDALDAADEAG